ncbi:MAG: hypothetical protein HQL11_00985 [Candidatus Omnitrophica bacterium]|nr:hypothetical protein [Candidatus Omnitrophota bacterium]
MIRWLAILFISLLTALCVGLYFWFATYQLDAILRSRLADLSSLAGTHRIAVVAPDFANAQLIGLRKIRITDFRTDLQILDPESGKPQYQIRVRVDKIQLLLDDWTKKRFVLRALNADIWVLPLFSGGSTSQIFLGSQHLRFERFLFPITVKPFNETGLQNQLQRVSSEIRTILRTGEAKSPFTFSGSLWVRVLGRTHFFSLKTRRERSLTCLLINQNLTTDALGVISADAMRNALQISSESGDSRTSPQTSRALNQATIEAKSATFLERLDDAEKSALSLALSDSVQRTREELARLLQKPHIWNLLLEELGEVFVDYKLEELSSFKSFDGQTDADGKDVFSMDPDELRRYIQKAFNELPRGEIIAIIERILDLPGVIDKIRAALPPPTSP